MLHAQRRRKPSECRCSAPCVAAQSRRSQHSQARRRTGLRQKNNDDTQHGPPAIISDAMGLASGSDKCQALGSMHASGEASGQ